MALGNEIYTITSDTTGLSRGARDVDAFGRRVSATGNRVVQSERRMGNAFTSLTNRINPQVIAVTALTGAFAGLTAGIGGSVAAYARLETRISATNALIRQTSGAAGFNVSDLEAQAIAQSRTSGTAIDQIRQAQARALTFTNIGGDEFVRLLNVAEDVSLIFNRQVPDAINQFAKALSDPQKRMGELAESGITFSDAQRDAVVALQEQGDLLAAQRALLDIIEGQAGGVAAARGGTITGLAGILSNESTLLAETFGELVVAIAPVKETLESMAGFVRGTNRALDNFLNWAETNLPGYTRSRPFEIDPNTPFPSNQLISDKISNIERLIEIQSGLPAGLGGPIDAFSILGGGSVGAFVGKT